MCMAKGFSQILEKVYIIKKASVKYTDAFLCLDNPVLFAFQFYGVCFWRIFSQRTCCSINSNANGSSKKDIKQGYHIKVFHKLHFFGSIAFFFEGNRLLA